MEDRITRERAHEILMKYMKGVNYIQHSYAVEAIMKALLRGWRRMTLNTGDA